MPFRPAATRLVVAAVLLAAALIARAAEPDPLQPLFPPGQTRIDIPLVRFDSYLAMPVRINDAAPQYFILDTGSNTSMVNSDFAKELKLDIHGKAEATVFGESKPEVGCALVHGVSVGGVKLSNMFLAVADFSNAIWPKKAVGILGTDWLGQMPFTIDFVHAGLTLFQPGHFTPPPSPPVKARISAGLISVAASIEGEPIGWFIVDSGSDDSLILENHVGGLHPDVCCDRPWIRSFSWGLGGIERNTDSKVKHVEALGSSWEDLSIICRSSKSKPFGSATAGNLGTELLGKSQLTVDTAHSKVWLVKPSNETPSEADGAENVEGMTTPLMLAAEYDQPDAAAALLKKGAPVDAVDFQGHTALMYAGSLRLARLLLDAGAAAGHMGDKGATALGYATKRGQKDLAELLIKHGADINAANVFGATPLINAAEAGREDIVELLLQHKPNVNISSAAYGTALAAAATHGYDGIVQRLIDAGADLNAMDYDHHHLPAIFEAIKEGQARTVRLLVKAGAKLTVTADTDKGQVKDIALNFAVRATEIDCVRVLLEAGMDPKASTRLEPSALDESYSQGDIAIIRLLYFFKPATPPASAPATRPAAD